MAIHTRIPLRVDVRGMRIRLILYACMLLLLSGCGKTLSSEGLTQTGIDFQRLFEIGYKIADPHDLQLNEEGLQALHDQFGNTTTERLLDAYKWMVAQEWGHQAARAMNDTTMARSIVIQEIIFYYEHPEIPILP